MPFKVVLNTDPRKKIVIQTPLNLSGIYKKMHYVDLAYKIDSPREHQIFSCKNCLKL